jgi:hypothetical protein
MLLVWPPLYLSASKGKDSLLDNSLAQTKSTIYAQKSCERESNMSQLSLFFFFCAVDGPLFDQLLETADPTTASRNTNIQEAVTLIQRLPITLRYLDYGNGFEDLKVSSGYVHCSADRQ